MLDVEEALALRLQAVRNSSSDQDGPQLWAQLCECLQAVGDTNGAIAVYRDVIGGEHTCAAQCSPTICAMPNRTVLPVAEREAQGPFGHAASTVCERCPSFTSQGGGHSLQAASMGY